MDPNSFHKNVGGLQDVDASAQVGRFSQLSGHHTAVPKGLSDEEAHGAPYAIEGAQWLIPTCRLQAQRHHYSQPRAASAPARSRLDCKINTHELLRSSTYHQSGHFIFQCELGFNTFI